MYTHAYKYECKNGHRRERRILLFRRMYFTLFRAVTEALRLIQTGDIRRAEQTLTVAQQATEDMYLSAKNIKRE